MEDSDFLSRFHREAARRGISSLDVALGLLNAFKDESVNNYKQAFEAVETLNHKLVDQCPHKLENNTVEEIEDSIYAHCLICKQNFGWRCPSSPDGVCHYFTDPEQVGQTYFITLIDKKRFTLPGNYNPRNESADWCYFCGQPEERK